MRRGISRKTATLPENLTQPSDDSGPAIISDSDIQIASTQALEQAIAEYSDVNPADHLDEDSQAFASGNKSSTPWMSSESEGRPSVLLSGQPIDEQQPSLPQNASEQSIVPVVEDTDIEEHDEIEDEADEPPAASNPYPAPESHDIPPTDQQDHVAPTQIVAAMEEVVDDESGATGDDTSNSACDVRTPAPTRLLGSVQRKGLVRAAPMATPGPTTAPVQPRKRLKPLTLNGAESTVHAPEPPVPRAAEAEAEPESPQCTAEPAQPETNGDDVEEPLIPAPERKRLKKLASSSKAASGQARSPVTKSISKPPRDGSSKAPKNRAGKTKLSTAAAKNTGGAPTKATKPKKDPNAPKKPLSSYMLWCAQERKDPSYASVSFGQVGTMLGDKWRSLSEEAKASWVEAATEDKARYAHELKEYAPPPTAAVDAALVAGPPKKKPKSSGTTVPPKRGADAAKRGTNAAAALRKAARATDVGSKARKKKTGDDDDSDEEDRAPSHGTAALRLPELPPANEPPPALDESIILPKARAPMRSLKLEPGVRIAWFPQPYKKFEEHYSKTLQELQVAELPSDLLLRPADGTANAAEIVSIREADSDGAAMQFLTVRNIGMDDVCTEDSSEEEFIIPWVPRQYCDVDQHLCLLQHYLKSRKLHTEKSHICVPFAAPDDDTQEEIWEGRVWACRAWDPHDYPDSLYNSLRCVWYVESREREDELPMWIFDQEQTDNEVSPWEAYPSQAHGYWSKKNAALVSTREELVVDRDTYTKLVPATESLAIEPIEGTPSLAALRQDMMTRVLKRLLSCEAGRPFLHHVPEEEVEYHAATEKPMCLKTIQGTLDKGGYGSWAAFEGDVRLIISNSFEFNSVDTLPFYLASMLEHELDSAKQLVKKHAPAVLEP